MQRDAGTTSQGRYVGALVGGKYRLVRFLAAGGMGAVYEAQHTVVKRRFALKLLHPDLAVQRESLARFEREAQAAGGLESEHIAAAVDFGISEDGAPYIVMEYLAGESLRALIERSGRVPVARAADIVVQACRGIEIAHRAGIVHRDINPQNLFVCRREDGTDLVKVLDFGIAKLAVAESAETRTGSVLGTPTYLSPEQARGEKTVGPSADVYALGAVLFELLSGERPHPGDSHNAILHHICTQPARPLDGERLGLPGGLVLSVNRALASQPEQRQPSAAALADEIEPFAKREVWPSVESESPAHTTPAVATATFATGRAVAPSLRARGRAHKRLYLVLGGAAVMVALALVFTFGVASSSNRGFVARPLPPDTRFFVPPPNPGAVEQIAALERAQATRDGANVTAMTAVGRAVWFSKGTPEEVQTEVSNTILRATGRHRVPVLVAYNRPYRDCAGFSAGGAKDTAAYEAWIDGLARGIGNERAVVILEPDGSGIVPYNTSLDGTADWCRPTVTDARGMSVPAPEASPRETYAQSNYAVRRLHDESPNALVYLDGTHSGWLRVGEVAYRLWKGGVLEAQGFAVNVAHFRPTEEAVTYATWISQCLYYATRLAADRGQPSAFRRCASQPMPGEPSDPQAWDRARKWYASNVDHAVPPAGPTALAHFVVDTSRNGQPPFEPARYAEAPYRQPASAIRGLEVGAWCNPPGMGLGLRPTADTHIPTLDAYLWIKPVGESDGACSIAGGARAWDYSAYNPWGIAGEGQMHFDPLWGMVAPGAGIWFPEQALELARRANPSLMP